ncbi:UDP-N-acetylglucosamine 1-carboxyvinyltransferase [Anaerolineales bacterium HSG24]|nr:UDP-N-acetylglucosamine 1-carboxyvinyltransferase [Anaerolineales bacterium HSG24]
MIEDKKYYRIEGGHPLDGTVSVSGAKNAVTKQLVASLLTDEPCHIGNIPKIKEIEKVLEMLSEVGTQYEKIDNDTLRVHTPTIKNTVISQKHSGSNRIPILMLAPIFHRVGEVTVPMLGGCKIGARPVNFHTNGLEQMGAEVKVTNNQFMITGTKLHGNHIKLPFPSVGATENLIMAATLAKGRTVIHNAAVEPEIIDIILFLQKMGALIKVDVDRRIIIEGVDKLNGARHWAIPDRIEVASFAAAAVATNGRITVKNAQQEHIISFLNALRKVGGDFEVTDGGIAFFRKDNDLYPTNLETDVHPGFMTDWQQSFAVILTQAHGASVIHETVMSKRFGYTEALSKMGAQIKLHIDCLGSRSCRYRDQNHLHSCIITGPTPLQGQKITIPDLRAGFAYIIAALVAEGVSEIRGIHNVERGYARIPARLRNIGAFIEVIL